MHQLLSMVNAQTKFIPELGGFVPVVDHHHETSVKGIFVCGDAVGIEEASSAMMEGYLTGLYIAEHLGHQHPEQESLKKLYETQLDMLRDGPFGVKTKIGLEKMREGMKHA